MISRRAAPIVLSLVLALLWLTGCEPKLRGTSLREMNQAEAAWEVNPILSYQIVVDVIRPDELRRNELTIVNGEVQSAVMLLWDKGKREWREPFQLDQKQAFPYTVPGLFETVRGAIEHSGRTVIRVDMRGEPPFPRHIEFGPVWEEMQMVRGTESEIVVRRFVRD